MSSVIQNEYNPDYVSPPGETLLEVLEERKMTQADLAERAGRPRKTISEIINGKAAITPDTALQLERVLGIPSHFWNQREQNYQDFLARQREIERLDKQLSWLNRFPVKEMIKLSWIEAGQNEIHQLQILLTFFAVASPEQWQRHWENKQLAYRKSVAFTTDGSAISVWLRQGEIEAEQIECNSFNSAKFKQALFQIRDLTVEPLQIFQSKLKQLCAESGVAVVFVPELPKTRVSGVARWVNPSKALIQLSLRYKSDDHLWFTFFHESKHVLQESKNEMFLEGNVAEYDPNHPLEQEANQFAADFLIPREQYDQFVALEKFSSSAISQFASAIGIAPGIVVGRLQHDRYLPQNHCNDLKQRFCWT